MPETVLFSGEAVVDPQPYEMNGVLAYKVTCPYSVDGFPYTASYWFAPEMSGHVVRFESHGSDEGYYRRMDVDEFIRLPDGKWFPAQTTYRYFGLYDGETKEAGATTTTVRDVVVNPHIEDDSIFSTSPDSLPPGTIIEDKVLGMTYVIGEGPVSQERIDRYTSDVLADLELPLPEGPAAAQDSLGETVLFADEGIRYRQEEGGRGSARGWWVAALLVAAAGLAVIAVLAVAAPKKRR